MARVTRRWPPLSVARNRLRPENEKKKQLPQLNAGGGTHSTHTHTRRGGNTPNLAFGPLTLSIRPGYEQITGAPRP